MASCHDGTMGSCCNQPAANIVSRCPATSHRTFNTNPNVKRTLTAIDSMSIHSQQLKTVSNVSSKVSSPAVYSCLPVRAPAQLLVVKHRRRQYPGSPCVAACKAQCVCQHASTGLTCEGLDQKTISTRGLLARLHCTRQVAILSAALRDPLTAACG